MFETLARHAAAALAAFFVGTGADAKPSEPAPPKPVNEAAKIWFRRCSPALLLLMCA